MAREMQQLHDALGRLTADGKFSGAVVIRGPGGMLYARGHGFADPFSGRAFTPETPVDSASLAKPVTAAATLLLEREGKIDLDAPVQRYLPGYPHEATTVRHLLAHSAGLPPEEDLEPLASKTNAMLMDEIGARRLPPVFTPGTAFNYCNFCYTTLALLIERVSGTSYLTYAQKRAALPVQVTIRPLRLADWPQRAVGYRRTPDRNLERADSYEAEAFYGSANLSISAAQLAQWGTQWWGPRLAPIRTAATVDARIGGRNSGLSWGSWYCARDGDRCHYLGHHAGFHHMLYWDAKRRISLAMVSNNTLAPALQQRLQRALIAFAAGDTESGKRELATLLPDNPVRPGLYMLPTREQLIVANDETRVWVERNAIRYPAYRIGAGIRYVPGLDVYLAGADDGGMHWLSLYEDMVATSF